MKLRLLLCLLSFSIGSIVLANAKSLNIDDQKFDNWQVVYSSLDEAHGEAGYRIIKDKYPEIFYGHDARYVDSAKLNNLYLGDSPK